ncbi:MAG: tetratricopeptide repeat protein [Alphaproteobacteria bacterium]|nr:tetratricopeptide repeat protein [Alphaproteobacteria bacterium]
MAPQAAKNTQALATEPPLEAVQVLRQAVAHYKTGDWVKAAVAAANAAEAHARYAGAYHLLALALDNLGQRAKAFDMFERAFSLEPANANLMLDFANAAAKLHHIDAAENAYRAYLERRPDCPKGVSGLAACRLAAGEIGEARRIVQTALDRTPESAALWNTLGTIMIESGDFDGAIAAYAPAQRLAPATARTFHNIAHAQSHTGKHEQAIANFNRALDLASDESDRATIRHARSLCHAAAGRLAEAWPDYEERLNPAFAQATHFAIPAPQWDGEDINGRKILVVGEQGLGDEIMFVGLIPDLIDRAGPKGKVLVAVDQRLVPLLQRSFPTAHVGVELHTKNDAKPVRVVPWATGDLAPDVYAPMGSLLAHLRPTIDSFKPRTYLKADPARVHHWMRRLEALGPGPYVGISWKSMLVTTPRKKFFSALEDWAPMLETTSVKFVNLQYGDCNAELDAVRAMYGVALHNFADIDLTNDIDDNAALCQALDLVVSSPTAPAMLAAATGTETWLLTAGPLWQQLGTARYPWYANTRVLTPEKFADWPALMQRLACEIEAFASR